MAMTSQPFESDSYDEDEEDEPPPTNKRIVEIERYEMEKPGVQPDVEYIDIHTGDDWSYRFKRLRDDEPFEFVRKRRHDTTISDCSTVPASIHEWFAETGGVELVDAIRERR